MPVHQFAVSDMHKMLAIYSDMLDVRRRFAPGLQYLLSETQKLVGAHTIAAYHLKFHSPLRPQAWPLLELKQRSENSKPIRTNLAGAAFIDRYQLALAGRAGKVVTSFGLPTWAVEDLNWKALRNPKHVINSLQFLRNGGEATAIALIVSRRPFQKAFEQREQAIVDTIWASHRIVFKLPNASSSFLASHA